MTESITVTDTAILTSPDRVVVVIKGDALSPTVWALVEQLQEELSRGQ